MSGHVAIPRDFQPVTPTKITGKIEKAPPEYLDKVYSFALHHLEDLSRSHRAHLTSSKRQMTAEQIKARGYKEWVSLKGVYLSRGMRNHWRSLGNIVFKEFGTKAASVPGFGVKSQTGREPYFSASGSKGFVIPVRDPDGRIVGAQIKTDDDDGAKYLPLSKGQGAKGAGSGKAVHVSRPTGLGTPYRDFRPVYITEGLLKADISSDLLGAVVITSLTGQSFDIPVLISHLRALKVEDVVIALDEDTDKLSGSRPKAGRRSTEKAKQDLATELHLSGFKVRVATWDPHHGKGLDDFLLGGNTAADIRYRATKFKKKRTGKLSREEMELLPVLTELEDPRPVEDLDAQREKLSELAQDVLTNRRKYHDKVILCRHLPGVGKSTVWRNEIDKASWADSELKAAYFLPTHQVGALNPGEQGEQVYGRTAESPKGLPCRFPSTFQELKVAGVPSREICKRCPSFAACKSGKVENEPFYHSQFQPRPKTFFPAQHFLSHHLVRDKCRANVVILDDIDLDILALQNPFIVTESDLSENLGAANAEPDPETSGGILPTFLRPGINLLKLLLDFRAYLVAEESETNNPSPRGSELVWELSRWCERENRDLEGALESAKLAEQPNPLDGAEFEKVTPGPKAIISELVEVLSFELDRLSTEKDWNSRLTVGKVKGGGLAYRLKRRINLSEIVKAYENLPVVILNADTTREQAERWFPNRKVEVIEPRAELPENARVWQYPDLRYGKTDLQKPEKQRKAIGEIRKVLGAHPVGKIGVITHKFFEEVLKDEFKTEDRLEFLHFFGQRSRNDCKDVRAFVILGTPHPDESEMIEQAKALFYDGELINETVVTCRELVEDISGQVYATHHRRFLDPRLQEQLEARTRAEMNQSLYRCRPLNLDAPQQGDLYEEYAADRSEVDVYAFTTIPLGIPVRVISKENPVKPKHVGDVLAVTAELSQGREKVPSQKDIWQAVTTDEVPVSLRQVRKSIDWIESEHGANWREAILIQENPPRFDDEGEEVGPMSWEVGDLITRAMQTEAGFWADRGPPPDTPGREKLSENPGFREKNSLSRPRDRM